MPYAIGLALYIGFVVFTRLVQRMQKRQIQRAWDTEKKITELQLSLVKNQLDPHFSLNALNAIVEAARGHEFDKIERGLTHYARMYRNMLLTAGKLQHSLADELLFTESYLELEKLRFGDRISYQIETGSEVDTGLPVPKMVVQLHVENAVKHGLAGRDTGGWVKVQVSMNSHILHIAVTDNGIGRQAADKERHLSGNAYVSTGKGLALMQEFYALYHKYYMQRITSSFSDLFDDSGNPAGTSVLISIHLQ